MPAVLFIFQNLSRKAARSTVVTRQFILKNKQNQILQFPKLANSNFEDIFLMY